MFLIFRPPKPTLVNDDDDDGDDDDDDDDDDDEEEEEEVVVVVVVVSFGLPSKYQALQTDHAGMFCSFASHKR